MAEAPTVIIGGEEITLPLVLNFTILERVWPSLKALSAETDPIAKVSAGIGFLSAVLIAGRPEMTVVEIKNRLRINRTDGSNERPGIMAAVDEICIASGLVAAGEAVPVDPPLVPPAPAAPEMTGSTSNT